MHVLEVDIIKPDEEILLSKPLLKWAGGKSQLISVLLPKIPQKYGKYIEPFIGGGALFFALRPKNGVIADSNPELVNLYNIVANNLKELISELEILRNTEEEFYRVRSLDPSQMSNCAAAARTIYLNKTCFNGLYRVNKKGQFNVPYGRYANPKILDVDALYSASILLKNTTIVQGDFKKVLASYAEKGDCVFLDPPYLPISDSSDFKRYTKEQFYEEDQVDLASEVHRLHELGCTVILTNSNHPLVHELYSNYEREIVQTKRYISCNGKGRKGEDVVVYVPAKKTLNLQIVSQPIPEQAQKYPSTRYMGSKSKLLTEIWSVASQFNFDTAVDLFSGSGVVSYMFKSQGKKVLSNDYMAMSATYTKAMIENNSIVLSSEEAASLLIPNSENDGFVQKTFKDLYFTDGENLTIDIIRSNIKKILNPYKRAIAMSALMRACLKKRPRGIFTYIGNRYNDGRKDLTMSFADQFLGAISKINSSIFDNGQQNKSRHGDAMSMKSIKDGLIYIDPPYYSPLSDNEYVRRYHFVEGLARDWEGVEIQEHTITKKFKSYPTPFSSKVGATAAFDALFHHFRENILLVSYSSNSQPTMNEMVAILAKYKKNVEVIPVNYKYSFGNQGSKVGDNKNSVQEYLFVGF